MERPGRSDIDIYEINAMDAATEAKNIKTFNMFILGGLIKVHPIVSVDNVRKALYKTLPQRHHSQIPENEAALLRGMDIIRKIQ